MKRSRPTSSSCWAPPSIAAGPRRCCARGWTTRSNCTRKLAPRILTTGGAGGDPIFTEGGVGRSYLISNGVPSEAIVVEIEGESTVQSTAMAGEIMRRMGLQSVIVVSDGYHIYRVKKMLQFRGLHVYGSPRREHNPGAIRERWNYVKQAIGYLLWRVGLPV